MLTNIIAIAIIFLVVGGAVAYIIRTKKKGQHCIGCPDSKICSGSCGCCASTNTCKNNGNNNGAESQK